MKRSEGVDALDSEKVSVFYSKNQCKFQGGMTFKLRQMFHYRTVLVRAVPIAG